MAETPEAVVARRRAMVLNCMVVGYRWSCCGKSDI